MWRLKEAREETKNGTKLQLFHLPIILNNKIYLVHTIK